MIANFHYGPSTPFNRVSLYSTVSGDAGKPLGEPGFLVGAQIHHIEASQPWASSSSTPVTHSFSEGPEAVYYASPSTSSMARGDLSQAGLPATSMPSSSPETQVSPNDGHSGAPSTSKGDPVKVPRPKGYPTENNSRIRCILSGHTCVHFVLPVSNIQPGCSGT